MCKDKNTGKDSGKNSQFLFAFVNGIINRPPLLVYGGLRLADNMGFRGDEIRDQVRFENRITYLAGRYALRTAICNLDDDTGLGEIWEGLPQETRGRIVDWSQLKATEMTGGALMSAGITRLLTRKLPKKFVIPSMLVLSCHGMMASIWRDTWGGPPPPGGMGGGGIST